MPEKERPSNFPLLPDLYYRTEFVPQAPEPNHPTGPVNASIDGETVAPPSSAGQAQQTVIQEEQLAPTGEASQPEAREQERLTLSGRVGAAPSFRTTPKNVLVGKFPLGVRTEGEKTVWHQVYVFRQRAELVRGTIEKGDSVDVIGYKHEREVPGRSGPRTVEEVYATVVTKR